MLDADPGNMVVVQRLLGHASPVTTAAVYGTSRTAAAQKVYARIVEALRGKEQRRETARKNRSGRGRKDET